MIRLAAPEDAEQLCRLNEEFNGEGENTVENIRRSLAENRQEVAVCRPGVWQGRRNPFGKGEEMNSPITGFLPF